MRYNSDFDFCLLGFIVLKHFENSVCFRRQVEKGGRRDPNSVGPLEKTSLCRHVHTHIHKHKTTTHTHTHMECMLHISTHHCQSYLHVTWQFQDAERPSAQRCCGLCVCMLGWSQPSGSPTARASSKLWTHSPSTTQFCSTKTSPTISSTWRCLSTIGGRRGW